MRKDSHKLLHIRLLVRCAGRDLQPNCDPWRREGGLLQAPVAKGPGSGPGSGLGHKGRGSSRPPQPPPRGRSGAGGESGWSAQTGRLRAGFHPAPGKSSLECAPKRERGSRACVCVACVCSMCVHGCVGHVPCVWHVMCVHAWVYGVCLSRPRRPQLHEARISASGVPPGTGTPEG